MAAMTMGALLPLLPSIMRGLEAGHNIFAVIERVPLINSKPDSVVDIKLANEIKFENVHFRYPTATESSHDTF